ncbi:hypothetical protein AAF712_009022 [Marasmius tenuissimus]|uniref:F-box domain-containing protein n=1 Tax=Marasmius tenuissimus TaxID=585030 RepID=A0ABR2ZQU8_9AGAR
MNGLETRGTGLNEIELAEILHSIADEQQDIDGYTLEIQRLQSLTFKLLNDRAALRTKRDRRRSFISTLRRIPEEILIEIFSYCIGVDHLALRSLRNVEEGAKICHAALTIPFRLSHVCSRWRAVLVNTPELWTTVSINLIAPEPEHLLEIFLQRSRGMDLDFVIWDHCLTRQDAPHLYALRRRAFRLLMVLELTARFKKFTMIDDGFAFHTSLNYEPCALTESGVLFPKLEYVHLGGPTRKYATPSWLAGAIQHAPRLHEAIFGLSEIEIPSLAPSGVRMLDINSKRLWQVLRLLQDLPFLEALTLRYPEARRDGTHPSARCPLVRDLTIIYASDESSFSFLPSLDFPKLTTLHLNFRAAASRLSLTTLSANLSASALSSRLRKLSLSFEHKPKGSLHKVLSCLPELVEFGVTLPPLSAHSTIVDLCEQLIRDPTTGSKIERLSFAIRPHGDFVLCELVSKCLDYLEAKGAREEVVTHFSLAGPFVPGTIHPCENDEGVMARLEEIEARGTRFTVRKVVDRIQY